MTMAERTDSLRVQGFKERAKTDEGLYQLIELRNGEIDAMRVNGAEYQADRRRKQFYKAWEENWQWLRELNEILGISGCAKLNQNEAWNIVYGRKCLASTVD